MMDPSLSTAKEWWSPVSTWMQVTPAGSAGTLHWPHWLAPHARIEPSLSRATQCPPPLTSTKLVPGGSWGTEHWLYPLLPQAATVPSGRSPTVLAPPAQTWLNTSSLQRLSITRSPQATIADWALAKPPR